MRNVTLVVLEPVPVNIPDTWYSRMVVLPKCNVKPSKSGDLEAVCQVNTPN